MTGFSLIHVIDYFSVYFSDYEVTILKEISTPILLDSHVLSVRPANQFVYSPADLYQQSDSSLYMS
jgi:hypothetical protein